MKMDNFDRAILYTLLACVVGIGLAQNQRLDKIQKQGRGMAQAREWGLTWAWNSTNRPAYVHNIVGGEVFSYPINYGVSNTGVILNP